MRILLTRCMLRPWARTDRDSLVHHGNNRRVWRNLADKMGPVREVFADLYGRGQFTPPAGLTVADMPDVHEARVRAAQARGTLRKD